MNKTLASSLRRLAPLLVVLAVMPSSVAAGANDFFAGAQPVARTSTTFDNNVGATLEPGELQPCAGIGSTLWFRIEANPFLAETIEVDTDGSNYDTAVAVYEGPATATIFDVSPVACDDDSGPGLTSYVSFAAQAGKTYYLQVGGYFGGQGAIQLNVRNSGSGIVVPNVKTAANGDGTCVLYDDQNGNGVPEPAEVITTYPCPNPKVARNPDGSYTVYDDRDNDGAVDPGEEYATTPTVVDGPHATVAPVYQGSLDKVYYKVGLVVSYNGNQYGSVQEGVFDGPLPHTTPEHVVAASPGPDADGDLVPAYLTLTHGRTTISETGAVTTTVTRSENVPLDPDPNSREQRVSIVYRAAPGPDADGDGVPGTIELFWEDFVVDPVTTEYRFENFRTTTRQVDPNDADNTNPVPRVSDGPYATVTPNHQGALDKTYYKVGLKVRYAGTDYGTVQEGVIDGPLPQTTPAYPYDAALGPDADGDGVPAYVELRFRTTTVSDAGVVTHQAVAPQRRQADPNDADNTNPIPRVSDGPYSILTPLYGGAVDKTYYKVGVKVRYAGTDYGSVQEGVIDGPLPQTTPQYAYEVTLGPDADGDRVPAYVRINFRTSTVTETGAVVHSGVTSTQTRPVDPNDADRYNPIPV